MSGGELLAAAGIAYILGITKDGKVVQVPSSQITLPSEVEFRPYLFRHVIAAGTSATLFTIETRPDFKTVIRLIGQNWFADSKWKLVYPDGTTMEWVHQLSYLFSPMSFNQPIDRNCKLIIENNSALDHPYNVAIFLEGPISKISGFTDGAIDSTSMTISTVAATIDVSDRGTRQLGIADILPGATIGTLADRVAAAAATQLTAFSTTCKAVFIRTLAANSGKIRVGDGAVSASRGVELSAGETIIFIIDNANKIYIFGNGTDKVSIQYVT